MNRGELPYSYYIVEYEDRNPNEYLTVSLRGIAEIKGEDEEFFTKKQLQKEIQKYRQVREIGFFKDYIKTKTFKHWGQKTLKKKFL